MEKLNYETLEITPKLRKLIAKIYKIELPKSEEFGLRSQITRAATSILINIAEGFGRNSLKEKMRFLNISRGSAYEVYEELNLIEMLYDKNLQDLKEEVLQISKMLAGLISYFKHRASSSKQ